MLYAIFLDIKLMDLYHQNSTVTMHMYVPASLLSLSFGYALNTKYLAYMIRFLDTSAIIF